MKFTVRQPYQLPDGGIIMTEIPVENIAVTNYAILSIDGSTSKSGLAIMRQHDGAILYSMCAIRDSSGETPVQYKVRLKRQVEQILRKNKFITEVYYEEPVIANITAVANLFMLRTFVEELIVENEPDFNYIKHYEVPNMRWKKEFLAPDKVPQGTDNQKKAVRDKIEQFLPFLNKVTQDEIDAICMGFIACRYLMQDKSGDELKAKKKARPFKYNVTFIGAHQDEDMFVEFFDIYKGPKTLLENGLNFSELKPRADFEKHIYQTMGDEDKLLIIKFDSSHHGNVILQNNIGNLSVLYPYLYAIVWRVTRK